MEPIRQIFDDVWHLGYPDFQPDHANRYFLKTASAGVLVDAPTYAEETASHIEKNGGLKFIFLTRKDEGLASLAYAKRFDAEIVVHGAEKAGLSGKVRTFDRDFTLVEGLKVITTPGFSQGSSCLLYEKHGGVLFTGDHVLLSKGSVRPVHSLRAWDWEQQLENSVKLVSYDFEAVLPGHSQYRNGLTKAKSRLERSLSEIESETV
jgi:glyoxylase-like metal-dependent hydrolase (beta-lactamase superfamily II)